MRDILTPPTYTRNPRSGADALRVRTIMSKLSQYSCMVPLRTAVEKHNSSAPSMDIITGRANADQRVLPVDHVTQLVAMQTRRNGVRKFGLLCPQCHARTFVVLYVHRLGTKSLLRPVPTQPTLALPVDDKNTLDAVLFTPSCWTSYTKECHEHIATNMEFHLMKLR